MNKNTIKSSSRLTQLIMDCKTSSDKRTVCSLVMSALEDRDNDLNNALKEVENIKEKYNQIVTELETIKSRSIIE